MNLSRELHNILDELATHHSNPKDVLFKCVEDRLNKSFNTYNEELTKSVNYLSRKDEIRVVRKLNKE